jgi:hypothetical protein
MLLHDVRQLVSEELSSRYCVRRILIGAKDYVPADPVYAKRVHRARRLCCLWVAVDADATEVAAKPLA